MSDGEEKRPRRALASNAPDDSAAPAPTGPRRGSLGQDHDAGTQRGGAAANSPFARPDAKSTASRAAADSRSPQVPPPSAPRSSTIATSTFRATPVPAPVLPEATIETPVSAPRRSALSSTTPTEAETEQAPHWREAHRKRLISWGVGGMTVAVLLGLISFFVSRGLTDGTDPAAPPSATATSSSTFAPITAASLVEAADLETISPASGWSEVSTTQTADDHTAFPFCLSSLDLTVNPTVSLQRTLGTGGDDKLVALHQIDQYADTEAATTVMDARIAALSNCSKKLIPARIVSASDVTGLAERTFAINLVSEDDPLAYHALLLTQQGPSVQLLEIGRDGTDIDAAALATSLKRPQQSINEALSVTAEVAPAVTAAPVPVTDPAGWLISSDLPRVRLGSGLWAESGQKPMDGNFATGCENTNLETEAGPLTRQVTRNQLSRDDQAPKLFGIDQAIFTFSDQKAAEAFASKIGQSLKTCKDQLPGSTVNELASVNATGADGAQAASRVFTINRERTDSTKNAWQAILTTSGSRVSYTLVSNSESYKLTDAQLATLADRVGVRLTQLPS